MTPRVMKGEMPVRPHSKRKDQMPGKLNTPYILTAKVFLIFIPLLTIPSTLGAEGGMGRRPMGIVDILMLPRVWVGALFCLIGLGLLMKSWSRRRVRFIFLFVIFFAFAIFSVLPLGDFARGMGLHPSPVCSITKPFLFLRAGREVPSIFSIILASIALLSVVGNKLFCGWACPIGALQEIFHRIPLRRKFKVKLPFRVTNLVRIILAALFVPVILSAGISIYDLFNPFESLHWSFAPLSMTILLVTIVGSVFIFRPFCYMVCPIGLFTWGLEHISLIRVKVNKETCTDCNLCIHLSPCPAVPAILQDTTSRPDCHACGRCLELCPEKALTFEKLF
jgi:polyferredoxin